MNGTDYITIGYNFLQISINAIEEMEKQGNKTLVFMDGGKSDAETGEEYDQKTKWADQNIGIPVLFNFYHGIELILKGLIIHCGGNLEKKTHKLSALNEKLNVSPKRPNQNLLKHFNEIISGNSFNLFFTQNEETVDSFYELFKYPELKNGKKIQFKTLRGQEEISLMNFIDIKRLAILTKENIIKWKKSA
ncbi:hypothetical protein [Robertkochia sediminum]|uniref:hypothetical protein n=1 Tax=Robertkochia sediminum TaxID=2785326 RepID=UPI001931F693|nr:hypothetical protein [Robertkochia sediminum]MBL7472328.1 hypothetical protein [Robertkochia sediminum]